MVAVVGSPSDSRHQAAAALGYGGVVRVSVGGFYATGVLLYDGRAVLTAAHLFAARSDSANVHFETVAGKETRSASAVSIAPAYDAANDNHDLALVWLAESAPVAADRHTLYRTGDEIGKTFTLVGYGQSGTGVSGVQAGSGGIRLQAENRFDADAADLKQALGAAMGWSPAAGIQLVADFDNGAMTADALGVLANRVDFGLGADEGLIAAGDSGGPAFIDGKVAGIASYTASLANGSLHPDIDAASNSSFGEVGVWQRVSAAQQWIDQTLRAHDAGAPTRPADVKGTVTEGGSGTVTTWFLVTLSRPARGDERLQFHTEDGSAHAGVDYLAVSDTLRFYGGETHAAIPVEVIGNARSDGDRSFSLVLTDPVGGMFAGGVASISAMRTIVDDDGPAGIVGVAPPPGT